MRTAAIVLFLSASIPAVALRNEQEDAKTSVRSPDGCDHECAQYFGAFGTETACAMHECVGCPKCLSPDSTLVEGCGQACAQYFGAFGTETACAMPECVGCPKCLSPDSTLVEGCGHACAQYFGQFGTETACAMSECVGCPNCTKPDSKPSFQPAISEGTVGDGSYVPPTSAGCGSLYRERQTGLKCGLHATNAVLENLHKAKTTSQEMDEVSQMVGEVSHGDDYDIATIMALLEIYRGLEISTSGGLDSALKPVSILLADVGRIDEDDLATLHGEERAAFEAQRRDVHVEGLSWLICNVHGHWKAYFKAPETWCNLDSIPARQGIPAAEVNDDEMKALQCRAIIVPTK